MTDRFFEKVRKTSYCWEWIAAKRGSGYGCMKVNGKVVDAHRLSWQIHNGEIPTRLLVCHTCDNRLCVNPKHLFLGTYRDNVMDCLNKGRMIPPTGIHFEVGHVPANRSIDESEVLVIKKAILNREEKTLKQLAIEMGYKPQLFADISCGRIYKDFVVPF